MTIIHTRFIFNILKINLTKFEKMVKMNLKHMFISHCPATEATLNASNKDLSEYFNKMKENGKEHGFDVIF